MKTNLSKLPFAAALVALALLGWTRQAKAAIPASERQALLDLYTSTNGAGWTNSTDWNGAVTTECTWFGVTCDAGQTTVQNLDLEGNNLDGSIPAELGNLTNLKVLDLPQNQLSGTISPELGNLTKLQHLHLEHNQLSGTIPPELGNLIHLQDLALSGNQLSGAIPSRLGNLTRLQNILLSDNQLVGPVPSSFTYLTNLLPGDNDFRWNGLYSADPALVSFLNSKQTGNDWQSTQTVPVTGLTVGVLTNSSVALSWTPIAYTGDTGGYEVFYATGSGGPYTLSGMTADKTSAGFTVTGIAAGTTYYFVVRSVTYPNSNNQNTVVSDPSAEIHTTAGGGACTLTSITSQPQSQNIRSGQSTTLFVAATGTTPLSYQWYKGASGDASQPVGTNARTFISAALTTTTNYWVRISNACGQADSATATVAVDAIPASERQALLDLYASTNGANWSNSTNWNGVWGTECTWFGVSCDSGRTNLQKLSLNNNNLVGTLPVTLGSLTNLQDLRLYSNQLSGSIPIALVSLTDLKFLFLNSNQLMGSIPTWLGSLTNLQYLRLGSNLFTGSIPSALGSLTNLQYLDLAANQLTGSIPTQLGSLTNLQYLNLYENQLSGPLPVQLGALTNLQSLELFSNQLVGAVPSSVTNLRNLIAGDNDFRWNGLYSPDSTVVTFLNTAQSGGDWRSTQTVPVTDLAVVVATTSSVVLTWTPIAYTGGTGGYEVFYATSSGGPYTLSGMTADKTTNNWTVPSLRPGANYYFIVKSVTYPGGNNQNTVVSDPSMEVTVRTPMEVRRRLRRAP